MTISGLSIVCGYSTHCHWRHDTLFPPNIFWEEIMCHVSGVYKIVISQKFSIKYYEYPCDYPIIIMN